MSKSAFPVMEAKSSNAPYDCTDPGMTLRDYFAAQVLPAIYKDFWESYYSGRNGPDENWHIGIASDAYMVDDAMIKARGQE